MRVTMIDPPSGWKYDFPKALPDEWHEQDFNLAKWLLAQGYPEEDLELAIKYSRYWAQDEEELC